MQQFKVITLSIGGHSNRIFESQDIVTAADFPSEENVLQHVLTGGLHPLNEDGTEMERVVITQEMLDGMTYEQTQAVKASGIAIRSGMYTYKAFAGIVNEAPAEAEEVEVSEDQIGEAIEGPRTEVPNDQPLIEETPGEAADAPVVEETTEAPKTTAKKSTAKK